MAINTTAGNAVKFLGLSNKIREGILKAMLGASVGGYALINKSNICYLGLSSTEPGGDGENISEPADWNYTRLKLTDCEVEYRKEGGIPTKDESSRTFKSDYLTLNGTVAKNEKTDSEGNRIPTEIKFNRSTEPWKVPGGEEILPYKYFFLSTAAIAPSDGNETGLLAWGELTEPITVESKNVVPLFEEGKFRLYFPTPGEVETIVDDAANADS